jgi:hypothetical protein
MFVGMHIFAAVGYVQDRRLRTRVLARLCDAGTGYKLVKRDGEADVHLWRFEQLPLTENVGAVQGSLVELAAVAGLPVARLRCALPEELCKGAPSVHIVGRRAGLSPAALSTHGKELRSAMSAALGSSKHGSTEARSSTVAAAAPDAERASEELDVGEEHVLGTALAVAFIAVNGLLPADEMVTRQHDASLFFASNGLNHGNHFEALVTKFRVLVGKFNLGDSTKWMEKARLWRFILLAHEKGAAGAYWDATPGLGLALLASYAPAPEAAPSHASKLRLACLAALSCVNEDAEPDIKADVPAAADKAAAEANPEEPHDCPLVFHHTAIEATLPACLRELAAADAPLALRCWTTALVVASMSTLHFGWLVDVGEEDGCTQRTLVDAGDAWLAAQAVLASCLPKLKLDATARAASWADAQDERISSMRHAEMNLPARRAQLAVRSVGGIMTSLLTEHETFSIFLAPGIDYIHRWQKIMILITCVIALLTVEIWCVARTPFAAACCARR